MVVDLEEGVDMVAAGVGLVVGLEGADMVVPVEEVDLYRGHKAFPLLALEHLRVLEGKE